MGIIINIHVVSGPTHGSRDIAYVSRKIVRKNIKISLPSVANEIMFSPCFCPLAGSHIKTSQPIFRKSDGKAAHGPTKR